MNIDKCPMCGKTYALIIQTWRELLAFDDLECEYDTEWYHVVCSANKGGCGTSARYAKTKKEAIKHWNRRYKPKKKINMIEYSDPEVFYLDVKIDGELVHKFEGSQFNRELKEEMISMLLNLGFEWE